MPVLIYKRFRFRLIYLPKVQNDASHNTKRGKAIQQGQMDLTITQMKPIKISVWLYLLLLFVYLATAQLNELLKTIFSSGAHLTLFNSVYYETVKQSGRGASGGLGSEWGAKLFNRVKGQNEHVKTPSIYDVVSY